MCMSSRTQAITNPLGHLLINNKKTYHRCVCHQEQAITNPARAPVNK